MIMSKGKKVDNSPYENHIKQVRRGKSVDKAVESH